MIESAEYSIYLVRCCDGSLYTGIAIDVAKRMSEHEDGIRGAKYLRGKGPLELVFQKQVGDRSLATRIEHRIKKMPKKEKQDLQRLPATIDFLVVEMARQ